MILALATLASTILNIAPSRWQAIDLGVLDPGTQVEVQFEVRRGSRVQALLVTRADAERFHRGRSPAPVCSSGFQQEGRIRCRLYESSHYVLVVDNRIEVRVPAEVRLRVDLHSPPSVVVRELPPERRRLIVALSLAFFGAVVLFSARQFLKYN